MKYFIKSITIIAVLFLLTSCTESTHRGSFANFYNTHKNTEDFFSFNVSPSLARLFISKEDHEIASFLKDLRSIKLLVYKGKDHKAQMYANKLKQMLPESRYQDVMAINKSGNKIEFKARERCKKIREMVVIVAGDESFVALDLKGKISLDKAIELAETIDLDQVKSKSEKYMPINP